MPHRTEVKKALCAGCGRVVDYGDEQCPACHATTFLASG